jgi:chromosome partitioning protein
VSAEAQEALTEYKEDLPLLSVQLHDRVAYKTSISSGRGVTEYESSGKAAMEIRALVEKLSEIK